MSDRIALLIQGLEFRRDRVLEWKERPGESNLEGPQRFNRILSEFVHFAVGVPEFHDELMSLVRRGSELEHEQVGTGLEEVAGELRSLAVELIESSEWKVYFETPHATMNHPARTLVGGASPGTFLAVHEVLSFMAFGDVSDVDVLGSLEGIERIAMHMRQACRAMNTTSPKNLAEWQENWWERLGQVDFELARLSGISAFSRIASGSTSAMRLCATYLAVHPGAAGEAAFPRSSECRTAAEFGPWERERDAAQEDTRLVTHILTQAAARRGGRHQVIERFARLCSWYARDHILDLLKGNATSRKEASLHAYMNEFLFREGYLPLAEVSLGAGRRVDTFAQLSRQLEGDHPPNRDDLLLIEVKQSLGKNLTDSVFSDFIGQAADYALTLAPLVPDLGRTVYLVIFHDGAFNFGVAESVEHGTAEVRPVLVDLGETAVSKRKRRSLKFVAKPQPKITKKKKK